MIVAAVTCPIDVCKTRIITRDRKNAAAESSSVPQLEVEVEVGFDTELVNEELKFFEQNDRLMSPLLSDKNDDI